MAKTAPVKDRGQSVHSRAARRATSPSINTDKSLKNATLPADSSTFRPSVLGVQPGAGVTKKSKHGRKAVLSSKAKRRQEKSMDRAEAVMDKKEKKVEKSRGRAKTVQERSKAWDDLNRKMLAKKERDEALALEKESWIDEDDDVDSDHQLKEGAMDVMKDVELEDAESEDAAPTYNATIPANDPAEKDDEIL